MKLIKARVQKYRSIHDTGLIEIEKTKTIFVGPNEAGKSAFLQALQKINPPEGVEEFNALRDYPRSEYNDISCGKVKPENVKLVEAYFALEPEEQALMPEGFKDCIYVRMKHLDNSVYNRIENGIDYENFGVIKKDLLKYASHVEQQLSKQDEEVKIEMPKVAFTETTKNWTNDTLIKGEKAKNLQNWLDKYYEYVDDENTEQEKIYQKIYRTIGIEKKREEVQNILRTRLPVFVYFNNYFRVRPLIHLEHLAQRLQNNNLDDEQYDYGNECLLKLLGFSARELADVGHTPEPKADDTEGLKKYRDMLDDRSYRLNAASVRLTDEIRRVWLPDQNRDEADRLKLQVDKQYLKVVVEDDLGVEVELSQRSEGFQWLVSFFVVFFAEAMDKHENAILLLDEPGLSLHGLKQRDFRLTISRLAENNQTLYTTHSPFLVGPDELDLVRVVEMTDRKIGTKIHTSITASDPAGLLPLQEALGYDLAQSLFTQKRNLVLEGLTDYWYLDATAQLLNDGKIVSLDDKISLIPANAASKVVYYATILHAQKLKVAALLDSDNAGNQAANQETLVHTLGNKNILRTKDFYSGGVVSSEIEDLLRDTLVQIAKDELSWDVSAISNSQPNRAIIDIFADEISEFSKYKLAKAYIRWTRHHDATDLANHECDDFKKLISKINKVLK